MADLGNIQYTDVNAGTRQVDHSAETRAIAQGLSVAETTIKAATTGYAQAQMDEALTEAVEQAAVQPVVEEMDPVEMSVFDMTADERAEATELVNTIRRGQAKLRQANGTAQRGLAILSVRTAQQRMKSKFGFVGSEIDAAANVLLNSSPEMVEMALNAQRSEAERKQTQDYIDQLAKEGYDEMNIPARYAIGSAEFAYEYTKRSEDRQKQVLAEQEYAALAATDKLSSIKKLEMFKETGLSRYSPINTGLMTEVKEALRPIDEARLRGVSDGEMAAMWQDFAPQANVFKRQVMGIRTQVERGFVSAWAGEDTESREYKGALAVKKMLMDDLDLIDAMITQGDVKIVDYIKTQQAIRAAGILDRVPSLRTIVDLENASPGLFDTIRQLDVTHSSTAQLDMISRGLMDDINSAGILQFGKLVTDPYNTGAEKDRARRDAEAQSLLTGTHTDSIDPRTNLNESMVLLDDLTRAYSITTRNTPTYFEVPGKFSHFIGGYANGLGTLYDWKVRDRQAFRDDTTGTYRETDISEQVDTIVDHLASDSHYSMYKALDPQDEGRDYLANQLEEYVLRRGQGGVIDGLKPRQEWYRQINAAAAQHVYGIPFTQYIELDIERFHAEDKVVFKLNEQLVRQRAAQFEQVDMGLDDGDRPPISKQWIIDREVDRLRERAAALSVDMTKYGRLVSMMDRDSTDFMHAFYRMQDGTNLVNIFPAHFPHTEVQ